MNKIKIQHLLILVIISIFIHGYMTAPQKKRFEFVSIYEDKLIIYDNQKETYFEKSVFANRPEKFEWREIELPE